MSARPSFTKSKGSAWNARWTSELNLASRRPIAGSDAAYVTQLRRYDLISAQFLLVKKNDSTKRGLGTIRFSPYPSSGSLNKVSTPADLPLGDPHNEAILSRRFVNTYKTALEHKPADSALHVAGRVQAGAKLGRLAVLKEVRGTGAGQMLVEQAELWLKTALSHAMQGMLKNEEKEARSFTIRLNSQMPVRGFYEK
jgi:GNAT superfamily N-acetyltransferase